LFSVIVLSVDNWLTFPGTFVVASAVVVMLCVGVNVVDGVEVDTSGVEVEQLQVVDVIVVGVGELEAGELVLNVVVVDKVV
jgi:hypothetical protein